MPAIAIIQTRRYPLELCLELLQHIELTVLDARSPDDATQEGSSDE